MLNVFCKITFTLLIILESPQIELLSTNLLLKVSRSRNMKQKIHEILTSPKNTNELGYPEQLYGLGMFMF